MNLQATSTFEIDTWEATPYDERDGTTLTRTHLTKTFRGEIAGTSTAELLMATTPAGPVAYVGFERITCRIHDREGSFVLHHNAMQANGEQSATWSVVPDSGAGDLHGLRGEARITIDADGKHTFTLNYDLD